MPGSEDAVRRMIEELGTGKPNYDLLSPGLGALQLVNFKGVGQDGVTQGAQLRPTQ